MTFLFQYLREHLRLILMQLLFTGIFALIFYLYHLPFEAVLYPAGICLFFGCLFFGRAASHAFWKHKRMTALQALPESELPEAFGETESMEEQDYQELIQKLVREMRSMEERADASSQEMTDYFTVWVHQIKTPISSMRLHLEAEDLKNSQRIRSDLLHIEQYVEMVLTYLKMGSDTFDYVFRTVSLDPLLREIIRKLRGDFIMKRLSLNYSPSGEAVVSDEKWLSFVIEQILSNALKYTPKGSVTISVEEPKTLCIKDTGIGIAPEDLPRVFEKGYTGGNGRTDKRASGLGLYLCKQICDRLGHEITVTSELEKGTTVRLNLSQYQNLTKM